MLRNAMWPSASVVNLPRRFMSAWVGSWFSYRPSVDDCQMSTSAPTTGLPSRSLAQALTNSSGPGVGERTIEPPFSVRGESSRQNGPSRFAVVEEAHQGRDAERTRRQHRLVVERIGALADRIDDRAGLMEFLLGQLHLT